MTTIVNEVSTSSIGSGAGRDFTSVQSWFDSIPVDVVGSGLSYVGEVYNDSELVSNQVIFFGSRTTNGSRTITLKAAAGHSFRDHATANSNPLRYDASKGAAIAVNQNYNHTIQLQCNVKIIGLQFKQFGGGNNNACLTIPLGSNSTGINVEGCIFQNDNTGSNQAANGINYGTYRNCLFLSRGNHSAVISFDYNNGVVMENCTIAQLGNSASSWAIVVTNSAVILRNCALFKEATVFTNKLQNFSGSNNASNLTLNFGTNNLENLVFADQFENITRTDADLRIKSTSVLKNAGMDTGTNISINNANRNTGFYDIGAWEIAEASTVPEAPIIGTPRSWEKSVYVPFVAGTNGGSPITGFTVTSNPGNITATGTKSPILVGGLTNGTAYTFTVVATNSVGNSAASAASASVTPTTPTATSTSLNTSNTFGAKVLAAAPLNQTDGELKNGGAVTLLSAGAFVTDATYGKVLRGTGTNGAATVPFNLSSTNVITLFFRMRVDAMDNNWRPAIAFQGSGDTEGGFYVAPSHDSGSFVVLCSGRAAYFPRPSAGVWHEYQITLNKAASTIAMKVDGVVVNSTNATGSSTTANFANSTLSLLGINGSPAANQVTGYMSNVVVMSGALTEPEFKTYNSDPDQIYNMTYTAPDTTAPTLLHAKVFDTDPQRVVLTFSEPMNPSYIPVDWSVFSVSNHSLVDIVTSTGSSNVWYWVTNEVIAPGEVVTVSYTRGANPNGLRDSAGNFMADFSVALGNDRAAAADTTPITIVSAVASNKFAGAAKPNILLTFSENVYGYPARTSWTISGHTVTSTSSLTRPDGRQDQLSIAVNESFNTGEAVTLSYAQPATGYLSDVYGNKLASVNSMAVTNIVGQDFQSASLSADGIVIKIELSGTMLTSSKPAASAFTVSGGRSITYVEVNTAFVIINVSSAYTKDDVVTVGYTPPGTNDLKYSDGTLINAFSNKTVSNGIAPGEWEFMGNENASVTVPNNTLVRYGAGSSFYQTYKSGSFSFNNATFGDPAPGASKRGDKFVLAGPATAYTLTGPSSIVLGKATTYTLKVNGVLSSPATITITALGMSLGSSTVTIPVGQTTGTFTVSTTMEGNYTISVTNGSGLTNPASINVLAATSIVKTVGTGKDYATLQAFATWLNSSDIVTTGVPVVAVLYENQNMTGIGIGPASSNNEIFCTVRPAPGMGVNELNANSPFDYPTTGIEITFADSRIGPGMHFENLRIKVTNGGSATQGGLGFSSTGWGQGGSYETKMVKCRILATRTSSSHIIGFGGYAIGSRFLDCLIIQDAASYNRLLDNAGYHTIINCTIVRRNGTANLPVFNQNNARVENSVFIGCGNTLGDSTNTFPYSINNFIDTELTSGPTNGFTYSPNLVENVLNNYVPKAGSGIIGTGNQQSISTNDIRGGNRGIAPDVGAWQLAPATPLVVATVTSQVLDGQTLTISGTTQNGPASANVVLTPATVALGAQSMGPIPVTLGSGTFTVTLDDIVPGNYKAPTLTFTNDGGSSQASAASAFSIVGITSAAADQAVSDPATGIVISGPTGGYIGQASAAFSVGVNGIIESDVQVNFNVTGGGTLSQTSATLTAISPSASFTYTPSSIGDKVITVSSSSGLDLPSPYTYTASVAPVMATGVTITGPTTGAVGVTSTDFTVAVNGDTTGSIIVTPSTSDGGTFTPTTVVLSTATKSATFKYTPASAGAKTITINNSGGLTNPASVTYTATTVTLPAPTGSITSVSIDGRLLTATGTVNLQGDVNGALVAYLDPQPSGVPSGPFPITVNNGAWVYTKNLTFGKWKLRVSASANNQVVAATSSEINVIKISGNVRIKQ